MYDGESEVIDDIENWEVKFDKIMTGDNGSSNKGAINPKNKSIKSLLINNAEFDISITTNSMGSYNPIKSGPKSVVGAFNYILSDKKICVIWGKINILYYANSTLKIIQF